ncbi:TetR/AcrR family transcriptional regulator, partial [Rhizobium ruizarguesonis]
EGVSGIQGALVLSRALDERMVFTRSLDTLARRLDAVMR